MSEAINLSVPYFSQRSNREKNGSGETVAWETCNLTSLCMLLNYLGITDDIPDVVIAKFKQKKYENDNFGDWDDLKKICKDVYYVDEKSILGNSNFGHTILPNFLKAGLPIMFSYGILSKDGISGHIAVLRGMTENGDWILNDPWGDPVNPWGGLKTNGEVRGVYVARSKNADITAGKGSGDNAILSKSELSKVCSDPLFYAMCILWPKQWCFFLRDNTAQRIRFGDREDAQTLLEIQKTLKSHLNFVLTDNGSIKKGLNFSTASGKNIYSCGPGRVVAIKNSPDTESNFILVMHVLPGNPERKIFMLYKGMEYINLEEEIKNGIYNSENSNRSWYEQLIQKIHTKAVAYDKGYEIKMSGDIHSTGLSERGIAYLIPQNNDVKQFAENIKPGVIPSYKECAKINDVDNYKKENTISFLTKTGTKKVDITDSTLIPQTVNNREYFYYRAKLAQLLSGETVVLLGEDDDTISDLTKTNLLKQDNFKSIFLPVLKDVFIEINFEGSNYENLLGRVTIFYQERFKKFELNNDKSALEKLADEFVRKCRSLCRKLLETPWADQTYAFSYKDKWYTGDKNGSFIGLSQVYETIYSLFQNVKAVYDFGLTWAEFEESVSYFYPANIDYFIEVTSGSALGKCTEFTSVECFSAKKIFSDKESLEIKKPHNKFAVISTLKKKGYLIKNDFKFLIFNYARKKEIEDFYIKNPFYDLNYVLHIQNPLKEVPKKKQKKIISDAVGNKEITEEESDEPIFENIFDNNLLNLLKKHNNIDLSNDKLYFYNPVKMISYLYELQNEQISTLKSS